MSLDLRLASQTPEEHNGAAQHPLYTGQMERLWGITSQGKTMWHRPSVSSLMFTHLETFRVVTSSGLGLWSPSAWVGHMLPPLSPPGPQGAHSLLCPTPPCRWHSNTPAHEQTPAAGQPLAPQERTPQCGSPDGTPEPPGTGTWPPEGGGTNDPLTLLL